MKGCYLVIVLLDFITKIQYNKSVTNISPFSISKNIHNFLIMNICSRFFFFFQIAISLMSRPACSPKATWTACQRLDEVPLCPQRSEGLGYNLLVPGYIILSGCTLRDNGEPSAMYICVTSTNGKCF